MAEKLRYVIKGDAVEGHMPNTFSELELWDFFRPRIGKISSVECDGNAVIVTGSARTLKLNSVTCGYGGTGPHGTARILQDVPISDIVAASFLSEWDNAEQECIVYSESGVIDVVEDS